MTNKLANSTTVSPSMESKVIPFSITLGKKFTQVGRSLGTLRELQVGLSPGPYVAVPL